MPGKGAAGAVAAKAGVAAEAVVDDLAANLGFAGCAHPLLMLAAALERAKAGEKILVLGFGQGADALLLEATGAAGQRSEEHTSELQSLMRISYAVVCLKKKKKLKTINHT